MYSSSVLFGEEGDSVKLFPDNHLAEVSHVVQELLERAHAIRVWHGIGKEWRCSSEGRPVCCLRQERDRGVFLDGLLGGICVFRQAVGAESLGRRLGEDGAVGKLVSTSHIGGQILIFVRLFFTEGEAAVSW